MSAADHPVAADHQHGGDTDIGEEANQRGVEGLQPGRDHALIEHAIDRSAEAGPHVPLARERLHDPDPRDALLGPGGELADPLLHLLLGGPVPPAVAGRGRDQEGHRDERQEGEERVEEEHRRGREQDREGALAHPDQPIAEEEADRLEIDGRPRHQLPGLLRVEEGELEPLQVLVEALAEVVLDRERDPAGDQPPPDRERQPQQSRAEQRQGKRAGCRPGCRPRSR